MRILNSSQFKLFLTLQKHWKFTLKIGITGGTGFIGTWICRAALSRGYEVTVATPTHSNRWRLPNHSHLRVVSSNRSEFSEVFKNLNLDAIILAGWDGVESSDRNKSSQQHNVIQSMEIVKNVVDSGISKIVGVGSQAEYGPQSQIISDDWELNPKSAYAEAKCKLWNDIMKATASSGTIANWVRIFSTIGPLMNPNGLLPTLIRSKIQKSEFLLNNPDSQWAFISAQDTANGILSICEKGKNSEAYNLSGNTLWNLREVTSRILGNNFKILESELRVPGIEYGSVVASTTAKLENLGWTQETLFENDLDDLEYWIAGKTLFDPFLRSQIPKEPI